MKRYKMEKIKISSDGKDMDLYILRPTINRKPKEKTQGILWIHGGGYVTGMAKMIYQHRQEYTPFYNWVMNCPVFAY